MSVIAWFFYGQRDQKPTEGESARGRSTAWGEPSPAVASAPHCVWGLGITWDHRTDLPFCLAQATAWTWKGGRGSGLRRLLALRFGDVVSLSPGAAWLCAACLEGFLLLDPMAVPWGWGTWPRGCRKAVAEQGHEGAHGLGFLRAWDGE